MSAEGLKINQKCSQFYCKISFKFLSQLFDHVGKRLDKKERLNFKIYDVKVWEINNYNTHIVQYLTRTIFLEISYTKALACNLTKSNFPPCVFFTFFFFFNCANGITSHKACHIYWVCKNLNTLVYTSN